MTDEELDELERLENHAARGPWSVPANDETIIVDFYGRIAVDGLGDADNAALICAARNALPALIAEVRRLRAMVGEDAAAVAPEDAATEAAIDRAETEERGGMTMTEECKMRRRVRMELLASRDALTRASERLYAAEDLANETPHPLSDRIGASIREDITAMGKVLEAWLEEFPWPE